MALDRLIGLSLNIRDLSKKQQFKFTVDKNQWNQ